MIYKKEANFPYPILSTSIPNYEDSEFNIAIDFEEDNELYCFKIIHTLHSEFLRNLLIEGKAQYILVIQSKDTKFFPLKYDELEVTLAKNRMSLSSRTSIQLHIVAKANISFSTNNELTSFYDGMKNLIDVPKNSMLAYSNVVTFEGAMKEPYEIFEKRLDTNLNSEIKIEIGSESIVIIFREEDFLFSNMPKSNALLNPYLYIGLRAALDRFLLTYAEQDEDSVTLAEISEPEDLLDFKLFNLMKAKNVVELTKENLDEVVSRLTNNIVGNYVKAVKGLAPNAD